MLEINILYLIYLIIICRIAIATQQGSMQTFNYRKIEQDWLNPRDHRPVNVTI